MDYSNIYDQARANAAPGQPAPESTKQSRVEVDVARIHEIAKQVDMTAARLAMHTRALGYFGNQPSPDRAPTAQSPGKATTLREALDNLDRAVGLMWDAVSDFD
jgi:hypothetical protein